MICKYITVFYNAYNSGNMNVKKKTQRIYLVTLPATYCVKSQVVRVHQPIC